MKGGIWEQTELPEQAICVDTWKNYPIGGEFASTYENQYFMVSDFDLTLESITESHQSFIGPKIIIDESDEDYSKAMEKILKTIGYRYYVDSVTIDMNNKETISISCAMGNDGIAPIYRDYNIKLTLSNEDRAEVWTSEEIDFDLRNVLPGEVKAFSCEVEKANLEGTKYTLSISVCDRNGNAVVPLALENEVENMCYQIAEFQIG
jgi:hypothetical protein